MAKEELTESEKQMFQSMREYRARVAAMSPEERAKEMRIQQQVAHFLNPAEYPDPDEMNSDN